MPFPAPEIIPIEPGFAGFDAAIEAVPDRPAVFLVWPKGGAPYLGRTTLLRRRLRRLLGERTAPSRVLNLRPLAARIEYWLAGSNLEASLLLYELALRHFPDTYLQHLKLRMPPYVKVILSNPFPRTQITARLGGGRSLYYGPFRTRASAEQFEARMLDLFQVRRCQEDLEPSPSHPGCIYGEMNMCLRPCQLAVSAEEYRSEVDRLVEFLATEGRSLAEPLVSARERLSEEMNFEEAARQHKQLEKVQQVVKLRDELVRDIDRLNGVAVAPSSVPATVELFFMVRGCWQPTVRFGFEVVEGKTISLDHRLQETVASLSPEPLAPARRQEHLALLARWYYSSWRDGEWLPFEDLEHVPYRKLVRALSRTAKTGDSILNS